MQLKWYLEPIDSHLNAIKNLFEKNSTHRHADNYLKWPLFEYTKFARMAYYNGELIYYSAGIERPEYNKSIRIMSRHTRERTYNFGTKSNDLARGLETLDLSTKYALALGYTSIWLSREESPKLFEHFAKFSKYNWNISHEQLHYGGHQFIMRIA